VSRGIRSGTIRSTFDQTCVTNVAPFDDLELADALFDVEIKHEETEWTC